MYIKREVAIEALMAREALGFDSYTACAIIREVPSADVIERKRGGWKPIIEVTELGEPYQSGIYCSECGFMSTCEDNFCPNCGADMRAEPTERSE